MVQIRTRISTGAAMRCGAYADPEAEPSENPEYYIDREVITTFTAWDSDPNPDEIVRTCERAVTSNSGISALLSWGGGDTPPDGCGGTGDDTVYTPEGCADTLYDPPADYVLSDDVTTVSGDSTNDDAVKAAALSSLASAGWSEWADLVEVNVDDGAGGGGQIDTVLAQNGASFPSGWGNAAEVFNMESELRVIGAFGVHLAVASGAGLDVSTHSLLRLSLMPGAPQAFNVSTPSFSEEFEESVKTLRCVCPLKWAASST